MLRKECLNEVGFFDESLPTVEDLDLFLRLSARFEICCLQATLSVRRYHQSNLSASKELALDRVRVFEKSRERFSDLAPTAVWAKCLASAYLRSGYLRHSEGDRVRATKMGLKSLWHAIVGGILRSPLASPGPKYARLPFRSLKLLGAAVVGFRTVQRVRGTLGGLRERSPIHSK